jgi:DNA gyrase subunit A
MEIGLVRKIDIDNEMQQAYLDYAMSVIVSRALPDARDGLKPVHRRILYAMHDMGLASNSTYKKSARIVGEVLGKYHPHGDMAVYDAMARMAQNFSMRGLLVDGQGNFGSVDGDPPAAMRYTEARLTPLATHLLADINKNTVDFGDNFDGTLTEPEVLPAAFPNLLVNGATGIAVGMATSIPPHNLGEVVDALFYVLEHWEKLDDLSIDELMRFIKGPDFPTGGVIIQENEGDTLASAYATGRGRVVVQAHAHLEEMSRGRNRIIVTELPYMTNKAGLIERIASLVREEKLDGIADLRDESDRQGMRIVIELNKAANPDAVLRDLYKNTQMRNTFSIIMLALVDGEPRLLSLKQCLRVYVEHRLTIVRRRSEYELERARQRAHILEGLRVALKNLDEVIAMIRRAPDAETARGRLMKRFKLTEVQAQAILDMPLRRLAALERKKIEDEYKEVQAQIKNLEALLRSPKKMRQVVAEELGAIKATFGDKRRTRIVRLEEGETKATMLTATDLVPEQFVWVMVTPEGLIARTADDKLPRLSGRDLAATFVHANTRDTLYLAATNGEAAAIPLHVLPQASKPGDGTPFQKVSPLTARHKLATVFTLPAKAERLENWFIFTATRQGMVKKTALAELPGPAAQSFVLVKINGGDRLGWVHMTDGQAEILLVTAGGLAIRFKEEEVRPMGLVAAGVMGIKLQDEDEVVGAEILQKRVEVFLVASDGTGKRLGAAEFPTQGRYGQGVIAWKLPRNVRVAGLAVGKNTTKVAILVDGLAPKSVRLDEAPQQGRAARGKRVIELKAGSQVSGIALLRDLPRPAVNGGSAGSEPNGTGSRSKLRKHKS